MREGKKEVNPVALDIYLSITALLPFTAPLSIFRAIKKAAARAHSSPLEGFGELNPRTVMAVGQSHVRCLAERESRPGLRGKLEEKGCGAQDGQRCSAGLLSERGMDSSLRGGSDGAAAVGKRVQGSFTWVQAPTASQGGEARVTLRQTVGGSSIAQGAPRSTSLSRIAVAVLPENRPSFRGTLR